MNRTMDSPRIERTRLRISALALFAALGLLPLAALAAPNGPEGGIRVYKWTDEQGVVHYGDRIRATSSMARASRSITSPDA